MELISDILFKIHTNFSDAFTGVAVSSSTDMETAIISLFILTGLIILVIGFITDAKIDNTPVWLAGAVLLGFGMCNELIENPHLLGKNLFSLMGIKAVIISFAVLSVKAALNYSKNRVQTPALSYLTKFNEH